MMAWEAAIMATSFHVRFIGVLWSVSFTFEEF